MMQLSDNLESLQIEDCKDHPSSSLEIVVEDKISLKSFSLKIKEKSSFSELIHALDLNENLKSLAYGLGYIDETSKMQHIKNDEDFEKFQSSKLTKILQLFPFVEIDSEIKTAFSSIIVGSGLAGLTAAYCMLKEDPSLKIVIVEKESRLGGNSIKASSGISMIDTPAQREKGISDSIEIFMDDTIKSGKGKCNPKIIQALAEDAKIAYKLLTEEMKLDLSDVIQCGGHSLPRTHRPNTGMPVGFSFVSQFLGILGDRPGVFKECELVELLRHKDEVYGILVRFIKKNLIVKLLSSSVILTTGGYACDLCPDSLLAKYVPHFFNYPTTNGPFANGSGIKLAAKIQADLIDLDQVQVHPTGFIDPGDRSNKSKFLAPEMLRGLGGILLNSEGKRFCNELGLRDQITQKLTECCKNDSRIAFLVIPAGSLESSGFNVKFYVQKKLLQKFKNMNDLCLAYNLDLKEALNTVEKYNGFARVKDSTDEFGKTVFPSMVENELYGCEITPCLHYTMGGLKIDPQCRVYSTTGVPISRLFAAGEAAGGVHGCNRLVGNSLLDCVVFGRRAGLSAAALLSSPL